jgi:hypothetical protein
LWSAPAARCRDRQAASGRAPARGETNELPLSELEGRSVRERQQQGRLFVRMRRLGMVAHGAGEPGVGMRAHGSGPADDGPLDPLA